MWGRGQNKPPFWVGRSWYFPSKSLPLPIVPCNKIVCLCWWVFFIPSGNLTYGKYAINRWFACYKWRCSHGHATNYPRASPSKWQKLYWNAHPACKTSHTNQNDSWRDQTCGGRIANTGMKLMKWYSFIDFPCFHMFSWLKKNTINSPLMVAETYRTLVPFPRPSAINLSTYQFYSHFGVVKTHMGVSENKVYPTSSHSFRGELMIKWWIWGCSPFGMSKTHTSYCIKLVTYTYNYIYAYIPL